MWKRLKEFMSASKPDAVSSDGSTPFYVYRVQLPDGLRQDVVSLLADDIVLLSGLTGAAIVGVCSQLLDPGASITEANFRANQRFVAVLHQVLATEVPTLPEFQAEARRQDSGWVYVLDARSPTPAGEVPPYDILGAFEVRDGAIVPHSYQANAKHRLFSSKGLFRLDARIHQRLLERLRKEATGSHSTD
jgi:hypothetical protein